MQAPLVTHDRVIDPTWFRTFAQVPKREYRIISIDPAFTENGGDFSAALVCDIVGDDAYLVHGEQVQYAYPGLLRWIQGLDKKWAPDLFVIEAIGSDLGLYHHLGDLGINHVGTIKTHDGLAKLRRMEMISPKIAAGRVFLPQDADWARQFLRIVGEFPYGSSDDWPNALSQLLLHFTATRQWASYHRRRRFPPPAPPRPQRQTSLTYGIHYRRGFI